MKTLLLLGLMVPAFAAFADIRDMDDEQIADVVITANRIAIESGQLAQSRAGDEKVKAFATRMIGEHSDSNRSANDFLARLNLAARNNPISEELQADAGKTLAALESLHGKAFDKAYIDRKIAFHQDVLDTIDNRLMPQSHPRRSQGIAIQSFLPAFRPPRTCPADTGKPERQAWREGNALTPPEPFVADPAVPPGTKCMAPLPLAARPPDAAATNLFNHPLGCLCRSFSPNLCYV